MPASIPELHPEYAHSEPYCFTARTESARVLVEKVAAQRGCKVDRADTLKKEGHVVVRGPAYSLSVNMDKENDQPPSQPPPDVLLTVESPTTEDTHFVDSDDQDENLNLDNVSSPRKSKKSKTRTKSRKKSVGSISHRSTKSATTSVAQSDVASRHSHQSHAPDADNHDQYEDHVPSTRISTKKSTDDALPRPMAQRTYSSSVDDTQTTARVERRVTPPELLAPIVVPRMSANLGDDLHASPSVSHDSWAGEPAERFEDFEEDMSSGLVQWSAVGLESVVHKADVGLTSADKASDLARSGSSSIQVGRGLRSKRKSKPFLHADLDIDDLAPPAAPDSSYSDLRLDPFPDDVSDAIPKAKFSRQISAGVMSDDIQIVDTSDDLFRIPSPAPRFIAAQRTQHDDMTYLPKATAGGKAPQGIMRRSTATTKRKTVSFHDESPVIIEPNLRAPSRSLPREAILSKDSREENEFKDASDLPHEQRHEFQGARDSLSLAAISRNGKLGAMAQFEASTESDFSEFAEIASNDPMPAVAGPSTSRPETVSIPRTLDIPRSRMFRELSDSSGTEDSFRMKSSRRMSRISARDKDAIRAASKRQSKAVAEAMAKQIRGVPKSAMLAFEENEVLISDDALDDDDSDLSYRRRSARQSKTVHAPVITPGVVPQPPPPPPFVPEVQRVRSVRKPPPPPSSPLSQQLNVNK